MKSVNTWNLTNIKLHQLFKDNNEFISIKVRGNTWEPITRWLNFDNFSILKYLHAKLFYFQEPFE